MVFAVRRNDASPAEVVAMNLLSWRDQFWLDRARPLGWSHFATQGAGGPMRVVEIAGLLAGLLGWTLASWPGDAVGRPAQSGLPTVIVAAQNTSLTEPNTNPVSSDPSEGAAPTDATQSTVPAAEPGSAPPAETAPVDGLKISSQTWRRGGLGSKALVTFTLRNSNDYAVKDVEITCAFARKDGSHLTDRTRIIPGTVEMKSRKTFARMHIGFVNINANKAKCSLVTASRI